MTQKSTAMMGIAGMLAAVQTALAATVTIAPGNGVETNVTTRFTGATDIVVNSGTTGGGIVTLANPLSTHTGKTTVNSGTLVVSDGDIAKGRSSIGASGPIVLGAGTLRASGVLGAVVTNTYAASSTLATVLDVQDELHITNDFVQKTGCFIKTGPGTVYFSGARNNFGGDPDVANATKIEAERLNFTANGDAPTTGRRGNFVLAEGTMVIEGGYNYFNKHGTSGGGSIGTWTAEDGETEKSAVLEIRGGTNVFLRSIWPGYWNGIAGRTGGESVRSGLRVTGGIVTNGLSGDTVFIGGQTLPSGVTSLDTHPFIEVTGGYMYVGKNIQLGNKAGVNSTLTVSGDGEVYAVTSIGAGFSSGPNTNVITVSGNGKLATPFINTRYEGDSPGVRLDLNVLDNGTLTCTGGSPLHSDLAGQTFNVLFDGGTYSDGYNGQQTVFPASLADVRVGTRGMTFSGNKQVSGKWQYIEHDIAYTNTLPGETRLPVIFKGAGSKLISYYRIGKNVTIDAPVRVSPYAYVEFWTNATLTAGQALELQGSTRLYVHGGPRTFKTLAVGLTSSTSGEIRFYLTADSTLTVTDEVTHLGTSPSPIYLYAADGTRFGADVATPGVYTVIDAPAASRDALLTIPFSHGNPAAGRTSRVRVIEENGRAKVQIVVALDPSAATSTGVWSNGAGDGLWKTDGNWEGGAAVNGAATMAVFSKDASVGGETVTLAGQAAAGGLAFSGANGYTITGGELVLGDSAVISSVAPVTNEIASALTATTQVSVNPARTGGGVMKLTGDLSGLAGGLAVNSGTLEVKDLSFATDASKLVVGPGTFAYTGNAAGTLEGITLSAGAKTGAVLRVDVPLTLKSATRGAYSVFVKTGAETLTLKGNGTFDLSDRTMGLTTSWTAGRFIGDSGDGPTAGLYGISVREGRLAIGTVGDDSDAPNVSGWSMVAGSQPLDGRPPAEIEMNNGTVTLLGAFKIDGYMGGTATNRVMVNGGTINSGTYIGPGVAVRSAGDTLAPGILEINGGVMSCLNAIRMFENENELEIFLNEGGTLKSAGMTGGSATTGAGVFHANGGAYMPLNNEVTVYVRYFRHFYLGEKGLVIDTTEGRAAYGSVCDFHFAPVLERDPALPAGVSDGGLRIRGSGICYFGSAFATDGITGDFAVEDGATLMVYGYTGEGHAVKMLPGGTLCTYESGNTPNPIFVDSLVLGEAGNDKPVVFEFSPGTSAGSAVYHCTVSNNFAVAGPVRVGMRADWPSSSMFCNVGVHTAFVYRAACDANVDVAKFTLAPELLPYVADFEKVDVVLNGETGWKAVVATVRAATAGELPRWTATSAGGNWSEAANWNGVAAPNDKGAIATFAPAQAADVPVTLDTAVTVGQAVFEATMAGRGYALGGNAALTFDSSGDALLDVATGGKVTVNAPMASDGQLCINAAQSGASRGTAGEVVFGAGVLDGFSGTLYPRSGRTTIPSLAWMTDAEQLRLGFGTVRYTGMGETIPGFVISPLSTYMAAFEIDNDLTVVGRTTMGLNGSFMKGGAGTLYLKGTGDYAMGNNHNQNYDSSNIANNYRCANGDSPTNATVNFSVGAGKVVIGELGATSGPTVHTSAYAAIGLPAGEDADAELEINSGTFYIEKHHLYVGYYNGTDRAVHPRLTVNGGTVNLPKRLLTAVGNGASSPEVTVNGGSVNVQDSINLGYNAQSKAGSTGSVSTFTMNGGIVTVQTNMHLAFYDNSGTRTTDGRLFLNGGELDVKGTLNVTRNSKSKTEAWLNPGGMLKMGDLTAKRAGGKFYFNGGLLLPYGETPDGPAATLASSSLDLLVTTNGAVIGTTNAKGGQYTVTAVLKHDPALAGKDGGLVKTGAGLLVLSGANTYSGPTVVDQGTLAFLAGAPFTDDTVVRAGAFLDLNGAGRTLGNLTGDGTVCNGSVTLAGALTPQNGIPTVDGDFATAPTACVDFGCTDGDMVALGSKHLVLRVTGTVDANAKFKAVNCGQPCRLTTVVEDGLVFVVAKSGGTVLFIR